MEASIRRLLISTTLCILIAACASNKADDYDYKKCSLLRTEIGTVNYVVYQPAQHDQATPLLLLFPGATSTYHDIGQIYAAREFADNYGYTVVLAQSPSLFWPFSQAGVEAVITLLDTVQAGYEVNQQVFLAGISNGSMISNLVACDYAHRLTGIFSASGRLLDDNGSYDYCQPDAPVGVAFVHGDHDSDIFLSGGGSWMGQIYRSNSVREGFDFWRAFNQCSDQVSSETLAEFEQGHSAETEYPLGCNAPMQFTLPLGGSHIPNWQPAILHQHMHQFFQAAAAAKGL